MSLIFTLGRAAVYLKTPDAFRGIMLLSNEVRAEVLVHTEVVMPKSTSEAAIAGVFACRLLTTLKLWACDLTALPGRLGDCAALPPRRARPGRRLRALRLRR